MNRQYIWQKIIEDTTELFESHNKDAKYLTEAWNTSRIQTLKRRWSKIGASFEEDQEHEKLVYKACKICVILKDKNLSLKPCISVIKASTHLLIRSENAVQEALDQVIISLQNNIKLCSSLDKALNVMKLFQRIENSIDDRFKLSLRTQIETMLNYIINTEDIAKLKENLNFIIQLQPKEKDDFKWIIDIAVDSSLKWIEAEKANTGLCDEEFLIDFENNSRELEQLINTIREEQLKSSDSTGFTSDNVKIENLEENYQENNGSVFPTKDFEEEMITVDRIAKAVKIATTSEFNEEEPIISTYRSTLDKSIPIFIKLYYQKDNNPSNLFLKELNLIKNLSGKHQCFLEYKGWFHDYSSFGIITEDFSHTLMEDIVNRSHKKQKYTVQEFQKIAICLLNLCSFLESEGIMHKNITPHNILITENGQLKIVEFNLTDDFLNDSPALYSKSTECLWNDNYLAPEIIKINSGLASQMSMDTKKSDVYSLGLVFLQMYSLLPIAELNTQDFWSEIDDYVSTFRPKNVADLLRKMLVENSAVRASFKESLDMLVTPEENKNESEVSDQLLIKEGIPRFEIDIADCIADLETIIPSSIHFRGEIYLKHLSNDVTEEFCHGLYNDKQILIRTYRSQDPKYLLQFIEEAKVLQRLNRKHITFIDYYGSMYSYNYCCEFSIVIEWCCKSLMAEITERRKKQKKYLEAELIHYVAIVLEGLIALKNDGIYHRNIKPYNIVFNSNSEVKITGFLVPETEIYSDCIFPENTDGFIQNDEGYSSPEAQYKKKWSNIDFERADVYSLGLILLQMVRLDSFVWVKEYRNLESMKSVWLSKILQQMIAYYPEMRGDFNAIFKQLQKC